MKDAHLPNRMTSHRMIQIKGAYLRPHRPQRPKAGRKERNGRKIPSLFLYVEPNKEQREM